MAKRPGLLLGSLVFPLSRTTNTIGRTDRGAEIHPDIDVSPLGGGRQISRRHAEIERRGDHFYLRDVGSQLGTLVNGETLRDGEWQLREGDAITFGAVTFTFSTGCEWPKGLVAEWESGESDSDTTVLPVGLPLAAQLPQALRDGHLLLHYQPQVDLATGEVSSVEALIRWDHPEWGMVAPDSYISLAEDSGFIRVLTTYALKEAAGAVAKLRLDGMKTLVGVNLSVLDLEDPSFGDRVTDVLSSSGTSAADFVLEVTERAVMLNPGVAIAMLDHLRSLGFTITIDDFGTGQSSLTYLKDLPAHEVKLDRSFSKQRTAREESIVTSAVEMAHALDMSVVAEGVEDESTVRFLRRVSCEKAQGYFFGKPEPLGAVDLAPRELPDV